jgi:hypothetical protein
LPGDASFIGPVVGHADGGLIAGPGGPRSDNILARLSPGEFVVNADATSQNRALLMAINSGNNLPRFADGGAVSALPTTSNVSSAIGGQTINVAPVINVSIEGGSRGAQADGAMGKQVASMIDASIRSTVISELRTQMKPGGLMRG